MPTFINIFCLTFKPILGCIYFDTCLIQKCCLYVLLQQSQIELKNTSATCKPNVLFLCTENECGSYLELYSGKSYDFCLVACSLSPSSILKISISLLFLTLDSVHLFIFWQYNQCVKTCFLLEVQFYNDIKKLMLKKKLFKIFCSLRADSQLP